MKSDQVKENTKQPYEKPKLRTIDLAAEEVLAIGCKMMGGDLGKLGNPDCGIIQLCASDGT